MRTADYKMYPDIRGKILGKHSMSLLNASKCFEHHVRIISSKLYYTASGIITPVGGHPLHRLREDFSQPVHWTATYRCDFTRCCIIQF